MLPHLGSCPCPSLPLLLQINQSKRALHSECSWAQQPPHSCKGQPSLRCFAFTCSAPGLPRSPACCLAGQSLSQEHPLGSLGLHHRLADAGG